MVSPIIPEGFIHIHAAIEIVGRHLYPDDWTGIERVCTNACWEKFEEHCESVKCDLEAELHWLADKHTFGNPFYHHNISVQGRVSPASETEPPPDWALFNSRCREINGLLPDIIERREEAVNRLRQLLDRDGGMFELRDSDGNDFRLPGENFWTGADEKIDSITGTMQGFTHHIPYQSSSFLPIVDKAKLLEMLQPTASSTAVKDDAVQSDQDSATPDQVKHLYPDAVRVPVSGRHHGLGDPSCAFLAVVEHHGCGLLC